MRFSYYRRPLFIVLALLMALIWLQRRFSGPPQASACFGGGYRSSVRGYVTGFPAASGAGSSFAFKASSSEPPGCEGTLFVRLKGDVPRPGETLELEGFGAEPRGARLPGGLDWASFLRDRGFRGEFRAEKAVRLAAPGPLRRSAAALRGKALRSFSSALEPRKAAVMAGVVLGEKKTISAGDRRAFQDSGAMHLLVASGSNVGFVTLLVYAACSLAGLGRRYSAPLALAAAGVYVVAAGADTPLLRAYLMFGAGLAGYAAGRDSGAFQGLVLSALALLLVRPCSLFDASFQMSFLAAYSVTAGTGAWRQVLGRLGRPARWALGLFLVSCFAQAVLAPALALYFHRLSLVSPVSNLLLVPLSGALIFSGFALAAFEGLPLLGWLSASAADLLSGLFLRLVELFARLDLSAVPVRELSPLQTAGWVLACFVLLHLPLFRRPAVPAGLGAAGLLAAAAGLLLPARSGAVSFSLGGSGASILSADGRSAVVVSCGFGEEELAGASLASGFPLPAASLLTCGEVSRAGAAGGAGGEDGPPAVHLPLWSAPAAMSAAGEEARPVWPGETLRAGTFEVRVLWADGREGYGEPSQRTEYIFSSGADSFRVGPDGILEGEK